MSQTKFNEYVVLSNSEQVLLSYFSIIPNQLNHSRGRLTDANSNWGVFTSPTPNSSNNNSFSRYASTPILSLSPGFYSQPVEVSISTSDTNVLIYYTTNGDWPDDNDILFLETDQNGEIIQGGELFFINETTVIRAIVYDKSNNNLPSFVETNTYFINSNHTVNVISISGDLVDNLWNGNQIKPIGSFEIFNAQGDLLDEATGEFNEHGNDSWAYDQRGFDYISKRPAWV